MPPVLLVTTPAEIADRSEPPEHAEGDARLHAPAVGAKCLDVIE
jgi:hypothetical protein